MIFKEIIQYAGNIFPCGKNLPMQSFGGSMDSNSLHYGHSYTVTHTYIHKHTLLTSFCANLLFDFANYYLFIYRIQ